MSRRFVCVILLVLGSASAAGAQSLPTDTLSHTVRDRAQPPYKAGLDYMRREDYDAALKQFQAAVAIDDRFEMAYYMIGRAQLALRGYASAVQALTKARDLYASQGTTQFTNAQERERYRRERINTLEVTLDSLRSITPQSQPIREEIRRLEEQKRQVEDMDRARSQSQVPPVPSFVSLSLGSAYFRSGRLAEAERAYQDSVAADPRSGEAHSNLAALYLTTGKYDDAEREVKLAGKVGFTVNPALKEELKRKKSGGESPL
jgi:tetratricopeptide (TPR) repeat protein